MKIFSKLTSIMVTLVLAVTLAGCGDKEQTKTFGKTQNGIEMSFTYHYKDDTVLRQTAVNKLPYSAIGAPNKEAARQMLEPMSKQYQNIEGLKEQVEYKDDHAIETLEVDYAKADIKKLSQMPGSTFNMNDSNWVSMKNSEAVLFAQGFTETK